MKTFFYWILLVPFLVISQSNSEYTVIENGMMTVNPKYITEFEAGVAAHNNKYHTDGMYGSRIYQINNGTNIGKYLWVMGPIPWSAFDDRPQQDGHEEDWNKNIEPYTIVGGDQIYWRFYPKLSNFPKDFIIKNAMVDMYDIKRFKQTEVLELMKKIKKVMKEKYPENSYGVYTNEFPNDKEGKDIAIVSFYQKSSWLGNVDGFPKKYEEVYGKGSFEHFIKEWEKLTIGKQTELWVFREDLSGISGEIKGTSSRYQGK